MRILVIDDDAVILDMLRSALSSMGHEVVAAEDGGQGLALAERCAPDLVITDVSMPPPDGIEVTKALKARAGDDFLPVIMITALDDVNNRCRGFTAGCDDYLAKPVNLHELRVRVGSLLVRRKQHAELRQAHARLLEADRLKKDLTSLVVHDLRNPLSALSVHFELLESELDGNPEARQSVADCRAIAAHALSLVAGLLDVAQLEEGCLRVTRVETPVAEFLPTCTRFSMPYLAHRRLRLETRVDPPELRAAFDPDLLGRVIENLVNNGSGYAPLGGRIGIFAARDGGDVVFEIGNDGPPIPPAERDKIFDKFYRIDDRRAAARANRGLGLYFCKLAAEAHGGTIGVEERPGMPACFVMRIPQ